MKYSKIEVYCQPLKFLFPISNVMTLESLQLQNNVNNLYIVLIFFLNIPIPCYIFIKQMSLFVLGVGYLCIIPCFTWLAVG
jgi:hypothetical protein